ncbi:MAG: folate-binding protein YgfZ [Rhodobacteraceae bacterium]|nr:folate-binding protein YgfZ [Paracoccaceae bacterium]
MPRCVIKITGSHAAHFLQNLITNDVNKAQGALVYAALLTPQGKFVADFFVLRQGEAFWLDVAQQSAALLTQRLTMYRLRADVQITQTDLHVNRGLGEPPPDGHRDPRHAAMGWRAYRAAPPKPASPPIDWTALRVRHAIPQTGIELTPARYILEMGFERLNGVDFAKGCYVGQEIIARMKHKAVLRKGLARVSICGAAEPDTPITAQGKAVGTLLSRSEDHALAFLRFDRAVGEMHAGTALVRLAND